MQKYTQEGQANLNIQNIDNDIKYKMYTNIMTKYIKYCSSLQVKTFDQCGPYFRNSNDCLIKFPTTGKSSNFGSRIYFNLSSGCSDIKLGFSGSILSNNCFLSKIFLSQCKKKWNSSSIRLQFTHNLSFLGIFLYRPTSISKLWSLTRNFVNSCLVLKLNNIC